MPILSLQTNVPKSKISEQFLKDTTALLAKTLNKPESYCTVSIIPDLPMAWGGSTDPCGHAIVLSIGQLGIKENKQHSKALHEHFSRHLGIPDSRLYIFFKDAKAEEVGFQKTTFHEILGK